jgi:hypothetical protein
MIFTILLVIVLLFGFVVFFGAPYVPSKKSEVKRAFDELYPLSREDILVDIGSGDGIVLRLAAQRGARAVGYEINPLLVIISRWLSRSSPEVKVYFESFWRATLPRETTVVYVFGDSRDIAKMAQKVADSAAVIGRPLFFISYAIRVPELVPIKQVGAHYLYKIEPLQRDTA